jgi:hypothetical protein
MPIGTLDYVSTAPWNDPTNPWPQYFQVSLSAADANLNVSGAPLIMQLTEFDPTAVGEQQWVYESQNAEGDAVAMVYNSGTNLVSIGDGNVGTYYALETTVRSVPTGWKQGNTNWLVMEGTNEDTLSIVPVTTYLNPWEYRRRRLLEMC